MKLVMTAAVMDLLHEGHINLLQKMRGYGDMVLVVLHDGFTTFENKQKLPIENLEKRTRNLVDSGLVDIVKYTFEKEPNKAFLDIIERYGNKFDDIKFVRGDDWENFPGRTILEAYNIPIFFEPYTKGSSSSKIRNEL